MCVSIETKKLDGSGAECSNTTELAASLGCAVTDLVSRTGDALGDNECLCNLDEDATAAYFGYVASIKPDYLDLLMTQAVKQ